MKNIFLLLTFLAVCTFSSTAQDFKKFSVGLGLGYAKPGGEGAGGGILVALEPGYRINDAIQLGLRLETAIVARGLSESASDFDASAAGINSYTLNGKYYLSNNAFRPFVGAGFGLFSLAAISFGTAEAKSESKIGFYPRLGFDLGHFNVTLDYNIVSPSKFEGSNVETKNSYFGIRIGGFFGGGKK